MSRGLFWPLFCWKFRARNVLMRHLIKAAKRLRILLIGYKLYQMKPSILGLILMSGDTRSFAYCVHLRIKCGKELVELQCSITLCHSSYLR